MTCDLELELAATECNGWPAITIEFNGRVIYDNIIVNQKTLNFFLECQPSNQLIISGINKSQGEYGIWDTQVDQSGVLIKDKSLTIKSIKFNQISMGELWIKNLDFINLDQSRSTNFSQGFFKNGSIPIDFKFPIIDWIIIEKFIRQDKLNDKFNYSALTDKMSKLQQLLND